MLTPDLLSQISTKESKQQKQLFVLAAAKFYKVAIEESASVQQLTSSILSNKTRNLMDLQSRNVERWTCFFVVLKSGIWIRFHFFWLLLSAKGSLCCPCWNWSIDYCSLSHNSWYHIPFSNQIMSAYWKVKINDQFFNYHHFSDTFSSKQSSYEIRW